jgi:hypothetical protein
MQNHAKGTYLDIREQRKAAEEFATKWQGRGYEKGDTQVFWYELLQTCLGVKDPDRIVKFEKRVDTGFPDVTIEDTGVIIEQKSIDIDLDKPELRQKREVTPYEQALSYAQAQPPSLQPRWIVTCNFKSFRIYDREADQSGKTYTQIELAELSEQIHLFSFIVDPNNSRIERERKVSIEAGTLIGDLHRKLAAQYTDAESGASQHSLNVLCVRLVFLLFAEDAGLFGAKDFFYDYLREIPAGKGAFRRALLELFEVLNTPIDARDLPPDDALTAFPYINGGLFAEKIEVPVFTDGIKYHLLQKTAHDFDWSVISPVVFGGVFESTLNPETRASGGMHYTSVENIHKVIEPLFLDALESEFDSIIAAGQPEKTTIQKLREFQDKLASLTFLDPACGSGNFLTETYLCLRRLENKILMRLNAGQGALDLGDGSAVKVSLSQFYGIEINDFAVRVATTALWIAELQANLESEGVIHRQIEGFPLRDSANIVCTNALTTGWREILAPERCSYIMGNPPFLGARNQSVEQKQELMDLYAGAKNSGDIDYVAGWYMKAIEYMDNTNTQAAFVSTNSITQGVQVANIWKPLIDRGIHISFAHRTFRWNSEASDKAHVFCVIIGFSYHESSEKVLYSYQAPDSPPERTTPATINAYLIDAPNTFIYSRKQPISDVPKMGIGNKPIDGGNYLFTTEEKDEFLAKEPGAARFFRQWMGSEEFINGKVRWCLWLGDTTRADLKDLPLARVRVEAVREFRLDSKSAPTQKLAERPTRFHVENMPEGTSVLIPEVSSERRNYVPIGFITPEILCSNLVRLIPNATLYHFGILTSQFHNAWMRVVAGRLKSDYRYSADLVYNNYPWPDVSEATKQDVETKAQAILDARTALMAKDPRFTLADLYDPNYMPDTLRQAHRTLDRAVERAYGVNFNGDEDKIVMFLFKLYIEVIRRES